METSVEAVEGRRRWHALACSSASTAKSREVLRAEKRGENDFKRFLTSTRSSVGDQGGGEAVEASRRRLASPSGIQAVVLASSGQGRCKTRHGDRQLSVGSLFKRLTWHRAQGIKAWRGRTWAATAVVSGSVT